MVGSQLPITIVNHDVLTQILLISSVINNVAVSIPIILSIPRLRRKIIKEVLQIREELRNDTEE